MACKYNYIIYKNFWGRTPKILEEVPTPKVEHVGSYKSVITSGIITLLITWCPLPVSLFSRGATPTAAAVSREHLTSVPFSHPATNTLLSSAVKDKLVPGNKQVKGKYTEKVRSQHAVNSKSTVLTSHFCIHVDLADL